MSIQVVRVFKARRGTGVAVQAEDDGQSALRAFWNVHEILALDAFMLERMPVHGIVRFRTSCDWHQKQKESCKNGR